MTNSAKIKRL